MTAAWKKTFALLVALQALALLGLAGAAYAAVWFGEDIRVRTAPVDPRDFLYGDYVTLSYEMSRLSPALWQGGKLPEEGDAVYVALEP
ncbi:GDYXXLXY domain-containing protein, partial [Paenibacillus sp.]|uniref:GDYXXLXY domain-containing protein n=1 Tax=Paenibacillus sp. TaxID=58172 RepID=UPI002D2F9C37